MFIEYIITSNNNLQHEKRNFVSPHGHVMYLCIYVSSVFNAAALIGDTVQKSNEIKQLISNGRLLFEERGKPECEAE